MNDPHTQPDGKALPPGDTIGAFVFHRERLAKATGILLEDEDLSDIGRLQNAITKLRDQRRDDPATLMYALISVPFLSQVVRVENMLGATHAAAWLEQNALTQVNVTSDTTKPLVLEISAVPFVLHGYEHPYAPVETLTPPASTSALPANDWYFPKPELFGMSDTPETRQGMEQLDEMITSFVAGFTGWVQMYHRRGNMETLAEYEVRLQELVRWLYARLSPRLQVVLLREPLPELPKVEMRPWAPAEEVTVKLDSVVETPKAPTLIGGDWGAAESSPLRAEVVNRMADSLLERKSQEPRLPVETDYDAACRACRAAGWCFAEQPPLVLNKALPRDLPSEDAVTLLILEGRPLFEKLTGSIPNYVRVNTHDMDATAQQLGLGEPGSERCLHGCWIGVVPQDKYAVESVSLQHYPQLVGKTLLTEAERKSQEASAQRETEGMRKRRALFNPPGKEVPGQLDPALHNSEITGADMGPVDVIEPEPRTDVKETIGSLPLAAARMFDVGEPGKTWREVSKAMEAHDAALAALCARSFLCETHSMFAWEVVSSWAASPAVYDRFQELTGLTPTHVLVAGLRLLLAVHEWDGGKDNPVEIQLDRRLTLVLNDPPGRRELVDRPPTTDGIFLAHCRADGVFLTALDRELKAAPTIVEAARQDVPSGKRVYRCTECGATSPWLDKGPALEAWSEEHNLLCGKTAG